MALARRSMRRRLIELGGASEANPPVLSFGPEEVSPVPEARPRIGVTRWEEVPGEHIEAYWERVREADA